MIRHIRKMAAISMCLDALVCLSAAILVHHNYYLAAGSLFALAVIDASTSLYLLMKKN